jgi:uncharacterized coiled-coil protein SlyX
MSPVLLHGSAIGIRSVSPYSIIPLEAKDCLIQMDTKMAQAGELRSKLRAEMYHTHSIFQVPMSLTIRNFVLELICIYFDILNQRFYSQRMIAPMKLLSVIAFIITFIVLVGLGGPALGAVFLAGQRPPHVPLGSKEAAGSQIYPENNMSRQISVNPHDLDNVAILRPMARIPSASESSPDEVPSKNKLELKALFKKLKDLGGCEKEYPLMKNSRQAIGKATEHTMILRDIKWMRRRLEGSYRGAWDDISRKLYRGSGLPSWAAKWNEREVYKFLIYTLLLEGRREKMVAELAEYGVDTSPYNIPEDPSFRHIKELLSKLERHLGIMKEIEHIRKSLGPIGLLRPFLDAAGLSYEESLGMLHSLFEKLTVLEDVRKKLEREKISLQDLEEVLKYIMDADDAFLSEEAKLLINERGASLSPVKKLRDEYVENHRSLRERLHRLMFIEIAFEYRDKSFKELHDAVSEERTLMESLKKKKTKAVEKFNYLRGELESHEVDTRDYDIRDWSIEAAHAGIQSMEKKLFELDKECGLQRSTA